MSFFTDPWLWNCDSPDDYLSGEIRPGELEQQQMARQLITAALNYAHDRGVTLVAAAGNSHFNLEAPERPDTGSPNFPIGTNHPRVVTNDCLDLPAEGPHVITVSALGPSTTKADYSNYGQDIVEVSAPGGWFRDFFGTPQLMTPANMVLSSYPLDVAIEEGLADENGNPTDAFSVRSCDRRGRNCGPAGGVEDYTQEGRPADWNAVCEGTVLDNGIYGEGVINGTAAVARRARP